MIMIFIIDFYRELIEAGIALVFTPYKKLSTCCCELVSFRLKKKPEDVFKS